MEITQIQELIRKYNSGKCTPEQKFLLEQWYLSLESEMVIDNIKEEELLRLKNEAWVAISATKQNQPEIVPGKIVSISNNKNYIWYAACASLLFFIVAGILYKFSEPTVIAPIAKSTVKPAIDILPGTSKAKLILANGSAITLESSKKAHLNEQGGTEINQDGDKLVYNNTSDNSHEILYNTLETPRGGGYQLVLPDGSKVWLNSSSSLRYPTKFIGNNRNVFLKGEAYFEVSHLISSDTKNKIKFIVHIENSLGENSQVEVLGTHFNINAYEDEASVATTLLEGSVKISAATKSVLLNPREQSQLTKDHSLTIIKDVNVDEVVAWKEGFFHFEESDITTILRQFSRWYDINIIYHGEPTQRKFFGIVSRSSTLVDVLKLLKANNINFKIDGRNLIVESQ